MKSIIQSYHWELLLYIGSRVFLILVMVLFLESGTFTEDIHFHYYFAKNPAAILTGDYQNVMPGLMGVHPPLYPFLLAPFATLIPNIDSLRIAFFFFEFLTLFAFIFLLNEDRPNSRFFLLMFILNPLMWMPNVVWLQDEIITAFFLLVVIHLRRKNETAAAFFLGFSLLFAKFFILLAFIPFILTALRKVRASLLILLGAVPFLLFLAFNGYFSPSSPFSLFYSDTPVSGINFLNLVLLVSNLNLKILFPLFAGSGLLIYYGYSLRGLPSINCEKFLRLCLYSYIIFFLFYPRTEPEYFVIFFPLLLGYLHSRDYDKSKECVFLAMIGIAAWGWQASFALQQVANNVVADPSDIVLRILNMHDTLIGNEMLLLEQVLFVSIAVVILVRYIAYHLTERTNKTGSLIPSPNLESLGS